MILKVSANPDHSVFLWFVTPLFCAHLKIPVLLLHCPETLGSTWQTFYLELILYYCFTHFCSPWTGSTGLKAAEALFLKIQLTDNCGLHRLPAGPSLMQQWTEQCCKSLAAGQHSPDKLLPKKRRKLHIPGHVAVRIKHRASNRELHMFNASCLHFSAYISSVSLATWLLVLFGLNIFLILFHSLLFRIW